MTKKILTWGEMPFSVPRTERVEGEQFPQEGLHEGIVYLTPVEDKTSKSGKKAFNNEVYMLSMLWGYIKDNKIAFQPVKPSEFHGHGFCFNRPRSEKDDTEQKRLLGEWAKNHCVCVLDCSSHKQLKYLTDQLDGKYINRHSDLKIITEPKDPSELAKIAFENWSKLVEQGTVYEEAVDKLEEKEADELMNNGFVINFSSEPPKPKKTDWDKLYTEESLRDNAPTGFPDLTQYVRVNAPSYGNGNRKGGGYNPAQQYDFIIEKLKEAGIEGSNAKEVVQSALSDDINFLVLNFVLSANRCQPLSIPELTTSESATSTSEQVTPDYGAIDQDSYIAKLKSLDPKVNPNVFINNFDWDNVDEQKAEKIYNLLNDHDFNDTGIKSKAGSILGKRLSKSFTLGHLSLEQLSKLENELTE